MIIIPQYLRVTELHEVVPDLFEEHDDSHLQAQINQTTARVTLRKIHLNKKNCDIHISCLIIQFNSSHSDFKSQ